MEWRKTNFTACHLGSKQNWRNPVNYSESSVVCANLCLCFITFMQFLILFLSIALLIHEHSLVTADHFHYWILSFNFIITSVFNQWTLDEFFKIFYIYADTILKTYLLSTEGYLILAILIDLYVVLFCWKNMKMKICFRNLLILCFLCAFI